MTAQFTKRLQEALETVAGLRGPQKVHAVRWRDIDFLDRKSFYALKKNSAALQDEIDDINTTIGDETAPDSLVAKIKAAQDDANQALQDADDVHDEAQLIANDLAALTFNFAGNLIDAFGVRDGALAAEIAARSLAIDDLRALTEDAIAPLLQPVIRAPATNWTASSANTAESGQKSPLTIAWFVTDDAVFGECAEPTAGENRTIGNAYPIPFDPDAVYKVTARCRVTDNGTTGGASIRIGASTMTGAVAFDTNVQKTGRDLLTVADGDTFLSCYFSANATKLTGLGLTIGGAEADDAQHLAASATAKNCYFHVRQNHATTDGTVRFAELKIQDVTELVDQISVVKTELGNQIDGVSANLTTNYMTAATINGALAGLETDLRAEFSTYTTFLSEGDFSGGSGDWTVADHTVVTSTTPALPAGVTHAMRMDDQAAYDGSLRVEAGMADRTLRWTGWVLTENSSYDARVGIHTLQSDGTTNEFTLETVRAAGASGWSQFTADITLPADVIQWRPYVRSTDTTNSATQNIFWAKLSLRDVSGVAGLQALLESDYYTSADADTAIAEALTIFQSQLDAPTGSIGALSATLNTDYYTKVDADTAIAQAITNLKSDLEGPSGSIGQLQANLTTNYYTKTEADNATSVAVSGAVTTLNSRIDSAAIGGVFNFIGGAGGFSQTMAGFSPTPHDDADVVSVANVGQVLQLTGNSRCHPIKIFETIPNRTFEFEAKVRVTVDSTLTGTTTEQFLLGLFFLNSDGTFNSFKQITAEPGFAIEVDPLRSADGWVTLRGRYTFQASDPPYFRGRLQAQYGTPDGDAIWQVAYVKVIDVSASADIQAALSVDYYTKVDADQAITNATTALQSTMEGASGSIGTLTANLAQNYYTKTATDVAIAASSDILSASLSDLRGSVPGYALHLDAVEKLHEAPGASLDATPDIGQSATIIATDRGVSRNFSNDTNGDLVIEIPADVALQHSARRIKIGVLARPADSNPAAKYALAYSTDDAGNSGEMVSNALAAGWAWQFFYFDVPQAGSGGPDYIGIWAGEAPGTATAINVAAVSIQISSEAADLPEIASNSGQITSILGLTLDETTALGTMLQQLSVDASGQIASLENFGTVMAEMHQRSQVAYVFRLKAGGQSGEFEMVVWDGVDGSGSAVTINFDNIFARGFLQADKFAVGVADQMLSNSDLSQGLTSFSIATSGTLGATGTLTIRDPGLSFAGNSYPTAMLYSAPGAPESGGWVRARYAPHDSDGNIQDGYPVKGGEWYEFHAQIATLRARFSLLVAWRDVLGNPIQTDTIVSSETSDGQAADNPEKWERFGDLVQAPPTAATARFFVALVEVASGADGHVWIHHPFAGETIEGAKLSSYGNGRATLIADDGIVTGSIKSSHIDTISFSSVGLDIFGGVIQSEPFVSGSTGWQINRNGDMELNNLVARGWVIDGAISDGGPFYYSPTGTNEWFNGISYMHTAITNLAEATGFIVSVTGEFQGGTGRTTVNETINNVQVGFDLIIRDKIAGVWQPWTFYDRVAGPGGPVWTNFQFNEIWSTIGTEIEIAFFMHYIFIDGSGAAINLPNLRINHECFRNVRVAIRGVVR